LLGSGDGFPAAGRRRAAQRSLAPPGPWRRVYGKLRPSRSPWARLVYEAAGAPMVQVRLLEDDDPEIEAPPGSLPAGVLGRLQIVPCADDPALPGLPSVLATLDHPRRARPPGGEVHGPRGCGSFGSVRQGLLRRRGRPAGSAGRMGGLGVGRALLRGGRAARLGRAVAVELVRRRAGRMCEPGPHGPPGEGGSWHVGSGPPWASSRRGGFAPAGGSTRRPRSPAPGGDWPGRPPPRLGCPPGCAERATRSSGPTSGWASARWCPCTGRRTWGSGSGTGTGTGQARRAAPRALHLAPAPGQGRPDGVVAPSRGRGAGGLTPRGPPGPAGPVRGALSRPTTDGAARREFGPCTRDTRRGVRPRSLVTKVQ
jgi:hypothetical protein